MKRSIEYSEGQEASKLQKVDQETEHQIVRLHEIPQYLHSSNFYRSLSLEDDEEIAIPAKHMKLNLLVSSISDLVELLNTIRFWILETILPELMLYLLAVNVDCTNILANFSSELKHLNIFLHVQTSMGRTPLARSMIEKGWTVNHEDFTHAVSNNCMHRVRYALNVLPYCSYSRKEQEKSSKILCPLAIQNGSIECVELLRQQHYPLPKNGVEIAATHGRVNYLQYMKETNQVMRPGYKAQKGVRLGLLRSPY